MSDYAETINSHYGQSNLSAKILAALQEAGKDIDALTREDLAAFDEYHGGGLEATRSSGPKWASLCSAALVWTTLIGLRLRL